MLLATHASAHPRPPQPSPRTPHPLSLAPRRPLPPPQLHAVVEAEGAREVVLDTRGLDVRAVLLHAPSAAPLPLAFRLAEAHPVGLAWPPRAHALSHRLHPLSRLAQPSCAHPHVAPMGPPPARARAKTPSPLGAFQVLGSALHVSLSEGTAGVGALMVVGVRFDTRPDSSAVQWLAPEQTAGGQHPYLFTQVRGATSHAMPRAMWGHEHVPGLEKPRATCVLRPAGHGLQRPGTGRLRAAACAQKGSSQNWSAVGPAS
jgi:hypothetical protein